MAVEEPARLQAMQHVDPAAGPAVLRIDAMIEEVKAEAGIVDGWGEAPPDTEVTIEESSALVDPIKPLKASLFDIAGRKLIETIGRPHPFRGAGVFGEDGRAEGSVSTLAVGKLPHLAARERCIIAIPSRRYSLSDADRELKLRRGIPQALPYIPRETRLCHPGPQAGGGKR